MRHFLTGFGSRHAPRRHAGSPNQAEPLELRYLPSAVWPSISEANHNDTIDIAEDLGKLTGGDTVRQTGTIGDTTELGSDVDWYQFSLPTASSVTLIASSPHKDAPLHVALSLYNTTPLEFDDPYNPLGHRLLEQAESDGQRGDLRITRLVAAGTYFVAVSGAGNFDFSPFLVGSGDFGETGDYELAVSETSLDLASSDGPIVLSAAPSANEKLDSSPLIVRVSLSGLLDSGTISPDDTLWLVRSDNRAFGDEDDVSVPLAFTSFSAGASELQLAPASPLAPGHYQVVLAGDRNRHAKVLLDLNGVPLGGDGKHSEGQDFILEFDVTGIEGKSGDLAVADDTPATAHELGNLTRAELIQARGVIGDDPFYDPTIDWNQNPANDVDMYHFQITESGKFALTAEVFAGRIGSPLDSGVSLFRLNSATGLVEFVAGNNSTYNSTIDSTGTNSPLFTDSALFAGLTAGDYYVAVSSSLNTPSPAELQIPGSDGMFDPSVSHSGLLGINTGSYVLNLRVRADSTAPTVISVTPDSNIMLTSSSERLMIRFSEAVNLQQLAFDAYRQLTPMDVGAVFVATPEGQKVFPRLESFDPATNQATFLMLDRLPDGISHLHLSGRLGVTDMANNPLSGNDASSDCIIPITIASVVHPSGLSGGPTEWTSQEQGVGPRQLQNLGTLFPREWQAGITVSRLSNAGQSHTSDAFLFTILQSQDYQFALSGENLPENVAFLVTDLEDNLVPGTSPDNRTLLITGMPPGNYVLRIGGWDALHAPGIDYQLHLTFLSKPDNPPPLTEGPAPAIQLRLSGISAPTLSPDNNFRTIATARIPQVTLPSSAQPGTNSTAVVANPGARDAAQSRFQLASWTRGADRATQRSGAAIAKMVTHSPTTRRLTSIRGRLPEAATNGNMELDALKDAPFGRSRFRKDPSVNSSGPIALYPIGNTSPLAEDRPDTRDQSIAPAGGESDSQSVSSVSGNPVDVVFGRLASGDDVLPSHATPFDRSAEEFQETSIVSERSGWSATVLAIAGWFSRAYRIGQRKDSSIGGFPATTVS